jgi:hypothetical protein
MLMMAKIASTNTNTMLAATVRASISSSLVLAGCLDQLPAKSAGGDPKVTAGGGVFTGMLWRQRGQFALPVYYIL